MPKNPFQADVIVLKDGGTIETTAGTSIIDVSSAGVPSIKANIQDSLAEGSVYVGDSAGVTTELDASTDTQILVGNGTTITSVAVSGDATLANTGALTIAALAVENSMVADSAGVGGLFVKKYAMAVYDFAVDGGTEGTITLGSTATIPDNALVTATHYEVVTTCTSATDAATIKLNLPTDGDLSTAIAISDGTNPWDAGAHLASVITPVAQKTTGARAIQIVTAGGEDITAGKIIFVVEYFVTV